MQKFIFLWFLFPFFILFSAETKNNVIKYEQPKEIVLKLKKNTKYNEVEKERLKLYAKEYINHNKFIAKPEGIATCDKEYCYIKYKIEGKYNEPTTFFDQNYHEVAKFNSKPNEDILGNKIENGKAINLGLYYNKLKSELQKKAGGNVKIQIKGGLLGTDLVVVKDSDNTNDKDTKEIKPPNQIDTSQNINQSSAGNIQNITTSSYTSSSTLTMVKVFALLTLSSLLLVFALFIGK